MQHYYEEWFTPAQVQKAREHIYADYLALGDPDNAARMRRLNELDDRTNNASYQPADLDQLLALLQEPGLDEGVIGVVFILLRAATECGQVPTAYHERLRQAALAALGSDTASGRQGGVVLLYFLGSREDLEAIAPLVDDPDTYVSKVARDVLEQWSKC